MDTSTIEMCGRVTAYEDLRAASQAERRREKEASELRRLREENARLTAENARLEDELAKCRADGRLVRGAADELLNGAQWRHDADGVYVAVMPDRVHTLAEAIDDTNFHPRPKARP